MARPPRVLWFGRTLLGVPGAVRGAHDPRRWPPCAARWALPGHGRCRRGPWSSRASVSGGPPGARSSRRPAAPEVGIEEETVSYSKGCYVGQETVARMRTYGHPTRGLVGLRQFAGSVRDPRFPRRSRRWERRRAAARSRAGGCTRSTAGSGWRCPPGLTQPGTRLAGDGRSSGDPPSSVVIPAMTPRRRHPEDRRGPELPERKQGREGSRHTGR